jgi:predicted nucleotidyltransferase
MIKELEDSQQAIAELCRRHGVQSLEVFGSAAEGAFDASRSDVDFIVEFAPGTSMGPWLARYFDLKEDLEALIGFSVDLVMRGAPGLANPYFAAEANRTRRLLYAA